MPIDTRLVDAGQHIMDTLVDALTDAGISVPDRRYLHTGQIAHDFAGDKCAEAFVVSWDAGFQGGLGEGAEGVNAIRCVMPLSAQFTVALLRCVPILDGTRAPSANTLQAAAESLMEDAWTLNRVIVDSALDGTLVQLPISEVAIGGSLAQGPSGGVGGVAVQLFVGLL